MIAGKEIPTIKEALLLLCLALGLLLSFSCEGGSPISSQFASGVDHLRNIPWVLTKVSVGNSTLKLNEYEPFHFFFGDSIFFGDDGCNSYRGEFNLQNNILSVPWISHTDMGCPTMKAQINVCLLVRRWELDVFETTLMLHSGDTTFIFSSSWTRTVGGYSFTDKHWRLFASNDTAFSFLNSHDLLPKLTITKTREFQFEWYFAPRNPTFSGNSIDGVFGIGNGQSIYLYRMGSAYASPDDPPVGFRDYLFVNRIIGSTRFSYSEKKFTLENPSNGTRYEFSLDL